MSLVAGQFSYVIQMQSIPDLLPLRVINLDRSILLHDRPDFTDVPNRDNLKGIWIDVLSCDPLDLFGGDSGDLGGIAVPIIRRKSVDLPDDCVPQQLRWPFQRQGE